MDAMAAISLVSAELHHDQHRKYTFSGTFHALRVEKDAYRFLGALCYYFNSRFSLTEMTGGFLRAICKCTARP
jgi:hypothetical protein